MSVFATGLVMVVVGALLILFSWFLTEKYPEVDYRIIIPLVVIGFILVLSSNIYVYLRGTTEELIRWVFWMRG